MGTLVGVKPSASPWAAAMMSRQLAPFSASLRIGSSASTTLAHASFTDCIPPSTQVIAVQPHPTAIPHAAGTIQGHPGG